MRQSASKIEEEAARWVMRLDRDGRSPAVEADLNAWLAGDTRCAGALLQAEAAWSTLDRARLIDEPQAAPGRQNRPPARYIVVGLAALAATVVGCMLLVNQPDIYVTGRGEVRRLPLEDGSTASINTESRLNVDFRGNLRRVKLDAGEAWFQVAKDPERPFRVDVGNIRVQAVGTAFSVRRVAYGVEVRVTEGVVRAWVEGSNEAVALPAGSSAVVRDDGGVSVPVEEPAQIDRELAWRSGRIDLSGETVGEAVTAFNRYNARALVFDDALASERLYGVFRLDDPDGFAASVALSLNGEVTTSASTITVKRRSN